MDRERIATSIRRVMGYGWPRAFPLVQFPNVPLLAAFVSGQVAAMTHGAGHADARAVSYAAMIVWAYEELVDGVNWFRHLLGLVYITSTVVALAGALGH